MIVNRREIWYNDTSYCGVLCFDFAAAAIYYQQFPFALGAGAALMLLLIVDVIQWRKRETRLRNFVESRIYEAESAKSSTLINFPLPIAIFKLADSRIVWGNEQFFQMCGETGTRLDASISQLVPQFNGSWILEGKTTYPTLLEIGGRKYQLHGSLIHSDQETESSGNIFMGITYWVDVTDYDDIRIKYENSRPVAGIIIIDNMDELMKNQPDRVKNDLRDAIEDRLNHWCAEFKGFLRRYDRDRYLLLLEQEHLEKLKEQKFKITDEIHEVVSPAGIAATISIGLGAGADNFPDTLQAADNAVELALSRGGDQTVIKNRVDFEFFGGRGSEVEKRTKVPPWACTASPGSGGSALPSWRTFSARRQNPSPTSCSASRNTRTPFLIRAICLPKSNRGRFLWWWTPTGPSRWRCRRC